jgi:hypothetical protein
MELLWTDLLFLQPVSKTAQQIPLAMASAEMNWRLKECFTASFNNAYR